MTTSIKTGYAPVNGLDLYHEIRGAGDPLVLLHGGVVGMTMFDAILPELASGRQVISVDLQGHGRTADIDRPLSFATMADDIVALLKHLGFENADVMGLSLGGGVALQVAFWHPRSVPSLWWSQRRAGARAGTKRSGPISTGWAPPPASS